MNQTNLQGRNISHLLFADDLVLFSLSPTGLQEKLCQLQQYADKWRLRINVKKTKILIFAKRGFTKENPTFILGTRNVESVSSYKYLGLQLHCNGNFKLCMTELQKKASKALFKLLSEMRAGNCSSVTILRKVFLTTIKPIIMYGSAIWGSDLDIIKILDKPGELSKTCQEKVLLKAAKHILGLP